MLAERLQGRILDLRAQIQNERERSQAKVDALQKQLDVLIAIKPLISPQLEAAVVQLQATGLLTDL